MGAGVDMGSRGHSCRNSKWTPYYLICPHKETPMKWICLDIYMKSNRQQKAVLGWVYSVYSRRFSKYPSKKHLKCQIFGWKCAPFRHMMQGFFTRCLMCYVTRKKLWVYVINWCINNVKSMWIAKTGPIMHIFLMHNWCVFWRVNAPQKA